MVSHYNKEEMTQVKAKDSHAPLDADRRITEETCWTLMHQSQHKGFCKMMIIYSFIGS